MNRESGEAREREREREREKERERRGLVASSKRERLTTRQQVDEKRREHARELLDCSEERERERERERGEGEWGGGRGERERERQA